MNSKIKLYAALLLLISLASCSTNKKIAAIQSKLDAANQQVYRKGEIIDDYNRKLVECENTLKTNLSNGTLREEQIADLKAQIVDLKKTRDVQTTQVGNLTVLTQEANANINKTLSQLETKDKYLRLLQAAKNKADSLNLALAVNIKGVLSEGLSDQDVDVKVDKTVVFVNLSDKMLFTSGSAIVTNSANIVLGKIAKILESRPDLEVMVEGYTDNVAIKTPAITDNWDLSVKRATSVVRVLQSTFKVDPNKMIAAGRGEYNTLTSNATPEGRSINRRTRIILLPKMDQFYDLLNPDKAMK
jgi:chemotaxis protein MotB